MKLALSLSVLLCGASNTSAWTAPAQYTSSALKVRSVSSSPLHAIKNNDNEVLGTFFPENMFPQVEEESNNIASKKVLSAASAGMIGSTLLIPQAANAAAPDALPSAFAAYGHYLSLLLITGAIMTERLTIKPNMSVEEEKLISYADIMTGVAGVGLLASGYYRATQYGKGWDFYSHEPLFWLKMTFLGIFGGLSLFPTITIIKRSVAIQLGKDLDPMSEKLAKRLTSVLNAEISALLFIPLTATLMSRGVGYIDGFPTQVAGPAFFGVVTAGTVFKYAKDALTWSED